MARMTQECSPSAAAKLSVVRAALTGSIALGVLYGLCWLVALIAGGATGHMYLELFTSFGTNPLMALLEGLVWSWVLGSLAGSLIALIYNALVALERR